MKQNTFKRLGFAPFAIGAANFLTFTIIAERLGGDAANGKEEAGHYFLAEHGSLTEVSKSIFDYSRFHAYSVWITHRLAIIGIVVGGAMVQRETLGRKRSLGFS